MNQVEHVNQVNQVNSVNRVNQLNRMNQVSQMNQVNKVNQEERGEEEEKEEKEEEEKKKLLRMDRWQGDINCGASSQDDFILNYFLSNLLSNFLSNSPSPPSPAGRQEQLMSPCCNIIQIVSSVWKYFFMPPCR